MKRAILCVGVLAVAATIASGGAYAADKPEKIGKDQLAGEWNYSPGVRQAFLLRPDGSGIMRSGFGGANSALGNMPCQWDFNEHYQTLIIASKQHKRQYKARMEDGKILLYEGRDVFYRGANMNTPLTSPLDKAVKAEAPAEEKAADGPEAKKAE